MLLVGWGGTRLLLGALCWCDFIGAAFGALFLGTAMVGGFLGRRWWGDESPVGANARGVFGGNMV